MPRNTPLWTSKREPGLPFDYGDGGVASDSIIRRIIQPPTLAPSPIASPVASADCVDEHPGDATHLVISRFLPSAVRAGYAVGGARVGTLTAPVNAKVLAQSISVALAVT